MSVRIYQLSKQINKTNKEIIAILQERGFKVDSPSNTIPDIYADELIKEFSISLATKAPEPQEPKAPATPKPITQEAPKPKPSLNNFVKSSEQVTLERQQKQASTAVLNPPQPVATQTLTKPAPLPPRPGNTPPPIPYKPSLSTPSSSKPSPLPPRKPGFISTPAQTVTASSPTPSTHIPSGPEPKSLNIKPPIVVRDFANAIGLKPFRLISELMEMGIFASMNQPIDEDIAAKIASRHGFKLEIRHRGESTATHSPTIVKEAPKPKPVKVANLQTRPAVVCVLGHVDHGKTSLLDTIRKANVASGEAGGITQHVGAYQVMHNDHKITFLDTPGHAAFSKMRERGANITDIAILVVAADDGFMPQTEEALKFAQKANVPVVVAINKMDAKGANIDRVKQQMQQHGIAPEDWGGQTLCTPISAIKNQNIDTLLELILLQAEMLELKADNDCPAEGTIIESQIEVGRGSTATVIVQQGVLKLGDSLVCGSHYCKVKSLLDDTGKQIKSAPASTPVRVIGFSGTPEAGSTFTVVKNEKEAKAQAEDNALAAKAQVNAPKETKKLDINDLFNAIASTKQKCLRVIIKADVHGSMEALKACLESIKSDKVSLEVISASVGNITPNDVSSAAASDASLIGFNTKLENGVQAMLKHNNTRYIQHNIIYELITQVKEAMTELLDPELRENKVGAAQVRQVFPLAKSFVAGCMVTEGKITRDSQARIIRGKNIEHEGRIETLKRFKDDASEVRAGYECGIQLTGFNHYKEGDIIECFEIVKIRPSL